MIHLIERPATQGQISEMLEALDSYIKLAVDTEQAILAGGGELRADCEVRLLDRGSDQADIWGADWIPSTQEDRFEALINIRSRQNNPSVTILDQALRRKIESIARSLLEP